MAARQAPPPAPAYTALGMAPLARPLQLAVIDGERWVCMRSLIEGLGIAWLRWANVFTVRVPTLHPMAATDALARPTWLLPHRECSTWLISNSALLHTQGNASTRRRLRALVVDWHTLLHGGADKSVGQSGRGRPRAITAESIRTLFAAWQQLGDLDAAAAACRISGSTARKLKIYSYPNPTADMQAAWQQTFGRL